MSSHFSFVNNQTDEYILINNNEEVISVVRDDFVNLYNIPMAPELPPLSKYIENKLKIKFRFNDFAQYKKYLQNKRKRQRRKYNKYNKKNIRF